MTHMTPNVRRSNVLTLVMVQGHQRLNFPVEDEVFALDLPLDELVTRFTSAPVTSFLYYEFDTDQWVGTWEVRAPTGELVDSTYLIFGNTEEETWINLFRNVDIPLQGVVRINSGVAVTTCLNEAQAKFLKASFTVLGGHTCREGKVLTCRYVLDQSNAEETDMRAEGIYTERGFTVVRSDVTLDMISPTFFDKLC